MKNTGKILLILVLLAIFIVAICFLNILIKDKNTTSIPSDEYNEIAIETPRATSETKPLENKDTPSLEDLKTSISDYIQDKDGTWAVYVENLDDGSNLEINNNKMVAASLIKLFIMGRTYEEIDKGTFVLDDVQKNLHNMITISDNEASNVLVSKLGGGKYTDMYDSYFQNGLKCINNYAQSIQCFDTEQQRDMKNSRPVPISEENYTSVVDCGKLLSNLYHQQLVSPSADREMLELLKQQTRRGKIPAGLPDNVVCANKTGELSDVENDVAIVFSPETDYIICVMSNDVPNTSKARNCIIDISKMVYNYFNK